MIIEIMVWDWGLRKIRRLEFGKRIKIGDWDKGLGIGNWKWVLGLRLEIGIKVRDWERD